MEIKRLYLQNEVALILYCSDTVVIKHIKLRESLQYTVFDLKVVEDMFGMCMVYFILLELPSMPKGEIDEL